MELKNSYLHCTSLPSMKDQSGSTIETIQPSKPHHVTDNIQRRLASLFSHTQKNRTIDQRSLNQLFGFQN